MGRLRCFFRHSLGRRLLLYFTLLMMIPLAAAGWVIYHVSDTRMSRGALRLSTQIMNNVSLDLDQMIADADDLSSMIAADSAVRECLMRQPSNEEEREQLQTALGMQLKRLGAYYDMTSGAYLVLDNGVTAKSRYYSVRETSGMSEELYQLARDHAATQWVNCPDGSMIVDNMGDGVLSAISSISHPQTGQPCGVIVVEIKLAAIKRMMRVDLGENSNVFLLGRDGGVLSALMEDSEQQSLVTELVQGEVIGSKLEVRDKKDFFVLCSRLPASGWTVAGLVYKDFLREDSRHILQTVLWIGLFAFLINIAVSRWLRAYELRPIKAMMQYVKKVETGDFSAGLDIVREDEVGALAVSMKNMTGHIQNLLVTVQQEQERLRWAEYKALQAQINPHFLFNTLNSFIALNQMSMRGELESAIYSLTRMLRYSLGEGSTSTVAQELEFLENYCMLQKLRFQKRLEYRIQYDPDTGQTRIPKLLLQPLVENAIIHGIEPSGQNCHLNLSVFRLSSSRIMITIEDDGIGFDQEMATRHMGLSNVSKRLTLIDSRNCMEIESSPGEGTIITLEIQTEERHEISDC